MPDVPLYRVGPHPGCPFKCLMGIVLSEQGNPACLSSCQGFSGPWSPSCPPPAVMFPRLHSLLHHKLHEGRDLCVHLQGRNRSLPGVLLCCSAHQALKGAPWVGSYSVVQCIRHLMGQPLYSGRNRGLPLRRRRGQGPHLAKRRQHWWLNNREAGPSNA